MQKLEILEQFRQKYGALINPELISMKYCQTETDALVEMLFSTKPSAPVVINLNFIADDGDDEDIDFENIPPYFKPEIDIVDNAKNLVEFDPYGLINCIDKLFTEKAEREIADAFEQKPY